jgi:hypothetical protein
MAPAGLGFGAHQSKLLFEIALPNRDALNKVIISKSSYKNQRDFKCKALGCKPALLNEPHTFINSLAFSTSPLVKKLTWSYG